MPDALNNREGPQARDPSKGLNRQSYEKDWLKRPPDCQLQEVRKKTLTGPQLLWWKQSMSLHTWHRQSPCTPSSCTTFMLNSHWGRAATGKKNLLHEVFVHRVASVVSNSLQPCRLWPARLLCQGRVFSKQECWNVLANAAAAKSLQSCLTLCNPMDSSPPGSSVHRIL